MTAGMWAQLRRAESLISAGRDENGKTSHLCLSLRPDPFLSLVPGLHSSLCGPPHSSRPASGPPHCAAAAPLSTAHAPHGKTGPYPHPGMTSAGVWSWTRQLEEPTEGGEATGSRRLAGKNPLKTQKTKIYESKNTKTHC